MIAPAVMLHSLHFHTLVDQVVLAFFVVCGVARLARFNVAAELVPKDSKGKPLYQEGFATAYAALVVSTLVAVATWMDWITQDWFSCIALKGHWCEFHLAMVPVFAMSTMMISKRLRFTVDLGKVIPSATVALFAVCWYLGPL